jgi:hypothetical protein
MRLSRDSWLSKAPEHQVLIVALTTQPTTGKPPSAAPLPQCSRALLSHQHVSKTIAVQPSPLRPTPARRISKTYLTIRLQAARSTHRDRFTAVDHDTTTPRPHDLPGALERATSVLASSPIRHISFALSWIAKPPSSAQPPRSCCPRNLTR